jgi:hypothetical protein
VLGVPAARSRVVVMICSSGPMCTCSATTRVGLTAHKLCDVAAVGDVGDVAELSAADQLPVTAQDRPQPVIALGLQLDFDRGAPPIGMHQAQIRAVASAVLAL